MICKHESVNLINVVIDVGLNFMGNLQVDVTIHFSRLSFTFCGFSLSFSRCCPKEHSSALMINPTDHNINVAALVALTDHINSQPDETPLSADIYANLRQDRARTPPCA